MTASNLMGPIKVFLVFIILILVNLGFIFLLGSFA
jgi:hypothetical protein